MNMIRSWGQSFVSQEGFVEMTPIGIIKGELSMEEE